MTRNRLNTQMFALRRPPPGDVEVAGRRYRLVRVFKHDFFAATCLYERVPAAAGERPGDAPPERIVVKLAREQPFCGVPLAWYGRFITAHEEAIYRALGGLRGVPRWVGRLSATACAVEYVEARPLDHLSSPPAGFFDRLRGLLESIHSRGVAYADANKRSNILISAAGEPFLVDYQIAVRRRDDWPWPLRALSRRFVAYVQRTDLYHLYKHKRRLAPDELTEAEAAMSRRRGFWHALHRKLTDPWRVLRRAFLGRQYRKGALRSPTEHLEDHEQPEKATWRRRAEVEGRRDDD
jgi:hypothetical protein